MLKAILAFESKAAVPPSSVHENYSISAVRHGFHFSTTDANDSLELDQTTTLTVRREEIVIVVIVLLMWVGVIFLFFSKWGKIRMLEPHLPQYRSQSFNAGVPKSARMSIMEQLTWTVIDRDLPGVNPYDRPRQNSVFVGSSSYSRPFSDARVPRKVKSAEDLTSLVLQLARRNTRSAVLSFGPSPLSRSEINEEEEEHAAEVS